MMPYPRIKKDMIVSIGYIILINLFVLGVACSSVALLLYFDKSIINNPIIAVMNEINLPVNSMNTSILILWIVKKLRAQNNDG